MSDVLSRPSAEFYARDGATFLRYDYEPSPADGWPSNARFAGIWVTRYIERRSLLHVKRVSEVVRHGRLWAVEVEIDAADLKGPRPSPTDN